MKRPSRGERWSATTTRQIGFFLPPTRVSRSRTDMAAEDSPCGHPARTLMRLAPSGRLAGTARQLLQRGHLAARDLPHQLLHLGELPDEVAHRLDGGPRAP